MTMKRILFILVSLLLPAMSFAQGLRVDDLGNRNVIVRINDLTKNYLLLPVQEDLQLLAYIVLSYFLLFFRQHLILLY